MKNSLLLVIAFITFASAQGLYFDAGLGGLGPVKTKIGNKDYVREANTLLFNNVGEESAELDIKIGYGPFGLGIPLYVAADFGIVQHNVFNDLYPDNNVDFITHIFGPSVIFYPVSIIQIGLSAGISVTTVEMTTENIEIYSDLGYMYSISAAYDFRAGLEARYRELLGNHNCLVGVKYFGAKNPTYAGKSIKTEMSGFFIKYAYIFKN